MKGARYLVYTLIYLVGCNGKSVTELASQGNKLDSAGNYQEAVRIYDLILEKDINRSDIFLKRAIDKGRLKDLDGEMEDLKAILTSDKNNGPAQFNMGIVQRMLGQNRESIFWFNSALKAITHDGASETEIVKDPDSNLTNLDIYFERGKTYLNCDSIEKSIADFTFVLSKSSFFQEGYFYRAKAYLKIGKTKDACNDLTLTDLKVMKEAEKLLKENCR